MTGEDRIPHSLFLQLLQLRCAAQPTSKEEIEAFLGNGFVMTLPITPYRPFNTSQM